MVHKKKRRHKCDDCGKHFTNQKLFNGHLFREHGIRPHKCDFCEKKFIRKYHLKRHMVNHDGNRPHTCDICGKQFALVDNLRSHEVIHMGNRRHVCRVCGKSFIMEETLNRHLFMHRDLKPFKCDNCAKCFTRKKLLSTHLLEDHGIKPHKCDICEKKFIRMYHLKRHKAIHNRAKPLKRDDCGKQFSHKVSQITVHAVVHKRKRRHKCKNCGKCFTNKKHLHFHLFREHGIKALKCDVCNKRFTRADNLRSHMVMHKINTKQVCKVCDKSFIKEKTLNRHLLKHQDLRPHKCKDCGEKFARKGTLNRHLFIRHRIDSNELESNSFAATTNDLKSRPDSDDKPRKQLGLRSAGDDVSSRQRIVSKQKKSSVKESVCFSLPECFESLNDQENKNQTKFWQSKIFMPENRSDSFASTANDLQSLSSINLFNEEEQRKRLSLKSAGNQVSSVEAIVSKPDVPSVTKSLSSTLPESFESLNDPVNLIKCKSSEFFIPESQNDLSASTTNKLQSRPDSDLFSAEESCKRLDLRSSGDDVSLPEATVCKLKECSMKESSCFSLPENLKSLKDCVSISQTKVLGNKIFMPEHRIDSFISSTNDLQSLPNFHLFTVDEQSKRSNLGSPGDDVSSHRAIDNEQGESVDESLCFSSLESFQSLNDQMNISGSRPNTFFLPASRSDSFASSTNDLQPLLVFDLLTVEEQRERLSLESAGKTSSLEAVFSNPDEPSPNELLGSTLPDSFESLNGKRNTTKCKANKFFITENRSDPFDFATNNMQSTPDSDQFIAVESGKRLDLRSAVYDVSSRQATDNGQEESSVKQLICFSTPESFESRNEQVSISECRPNTIFVPENRSDSSASSINELLIESHFDQFTDEKQRTRLDSGSTGANLPCCQAILGKPDVPSVNELLCSTLPKNFESLNKQVNITECQPNNFFIPENRSDSFSLVTNDMQSQSDSDLFTADESGKRLGLESAGSQVSSLEAIVSKQNARSVNETVCLDIPGCFESVNDQASIARCISTESDKMDQDFAAVQKSLTVLKDRDCSHTDISFPSSDFYLNKYKNATSISNYYPDFEASRNSSLLQIKLFLKIYSSSAVNEVRDFPPSRYSQECINECSISVNELKKIS